MMKKSNDWSFFNIKLKPFFYTLFLTSPITMAIENALAKMQE